MSRVNWMSIATYLVLVVCLVLAFFIGYYGLNNLNTALAEVDNINHQIAVQDKISQDIERRRQRLNGILVVPDTKQEEGEFLRQLYLLMLAAGVKPVQVERATVTPLPSIEKPPVDPSGKSQPGKPANARPDPSILNLPLGARAIVSNVSVQGPYANIRQFSYMIRNYRYRARALNMNNIQLTTVDEKGNLQATMSLTRFVAPEDKSKALQPPPEMNIPDNTQRLPSNVPYTPGMPGNPETPPHPGIRPAPKRDATNP